MVGYRMLFGVPDEITDVTRVSGMVRKRRLIYRMTSFDYRKVFGVTGNVPGMTNGFREFTGGGGGEPPPRGPIHQEKEIKGKEKKRGKKWEGRGTPPTKPSPTRFGGGVLPPLARPTPWGSLDPKARPPPSHLYIRRF